MGSGGGGEVGGGGLTLAYQSHDPDVVAGVLTEEVLTPMSGPNDAAERDPGDGVETYYYDNGSHESFYRDALMALREAHQRNDHGNSEKIWNLWTVWCERSLPSLGFRGLMERLERLNVWRKHDAWPVFKTAGTPCLPFTATVTRMMKR